MKPTLFSFIFIFTALYAIGQTPYKQKLAGLATIDFPAAPKAADTMGHATYVYKDSTALYVVLTKEYGKDELMLNADKTGEFYDGTVRGILKQANGTLISKKPFEIKGLKGVDIVYSTASNPNLPNLRFERILLINNTVFNIDLWIDAKNKETTAAARDRFFNSLALTADQSTLKQGNKQETAFNIGYLIGQVTVWVIVFGVIAGIVIAIVKSGKKRKK